MDIKDKKTILVLPGTLWQVELVKKIKEKGFKAIVVNPDVNSPCFEYADEYLISDIFDKKKVIDFAKENHITGILSDECDIAMNLIAELGSEFSLPTIDEETAHLFTDKFQMREFSKKIDLPSPEYKICNNLSDVIEFQKKLNVPIIIKPTDSNASHGVFKCLNKEDIKKHFSETLSFSRINKNVLAERYIEGPEFTIDGIKTPWGHYTLAISEKKHFSHNDSIANELLFTHENQKYDYNVLKKLNDRFVLASNLSFGFTHAEYKYDNGKFYLIEIAARGGGNMISSCITQFMSGFDTYDYLIDCSQGKIENKDFSLPSHLRDRAAVLKFFSTPLGGGRVKEIKGKDFLINSPEIKKFKFNFREGDVIKDASNDSARIGFYIACCENVEDLKKLMKKIDETVKIIIE